mmetsp:Transcript_110681/g.308402  ORF Transcript_110681/g.308402 Transcript_110681/m.308402 type:complete len:227 (-) Transcript_110681:349-1029(-)
MARIICIIGARTPPCSPPVALGALTPSPPPSCSSPPSGRDATGSGCGEPSCTAKRRTSLAASSTSCAASRASARYSSSARTIEASCASLSVPISAPKRRWSSRRRAAARAAAGESVAFCREKAKDSKRSLRRSTFRNSAGAPTLSSSSSCPPPALPSSLMRPPPLALPFGGLTRARRSLLSRAASLASFEPRAEAMLAPTSPITRAGTPQAMTVCRRLRAASSQTA